MGRPHRGRRIGHNPNTTFFKPAGISSRELQTTSILLDELEAMRLVDGEELRQTEAAERMGISQSTIARLLALGRKKTALALAHGEALQLQKGDAPLNYSDAPCSGRRRGQRGAGTCAKNKSMGRARGFGGGCGRGAGRGMGRGLGLRVTDQTPILREEQLKSMQAKAVGLEQQFKDLNEQIEKLESE